MKVTLSLTHQCNLACSYCYAGISRKPDMPPDLARQCIDSALTWLPPDASLEVGLFGGEPLLKFDLIKEIVAYTHSRAQETATPVHIGLTTNGTLLSPDILDFFADKDIRLCVSIDGPQEVHDRNRCYAGGRGSFTEVAANLDLAVKRLGVVEVNAVTGPDTLAAMPQTLDFFIDRGISVIHFNPDIKASWPDAVCDRFDEVYRQVAERYIDYYRQGTELALNLIDSKMVLFIKGGYSQSDRCAMGDGEWGIAPSGNIYPCERFIGEDIDHTFCLGNIRTGLDQERRCALRQKRGNNRIECATCFYKSFCMSWCGCTNWFMSGQSDLPAPALCAMEKAAIEAARHAFETLVKEDNDLFADHLFNYVKTENHRQDGCRRCDQEPRHEAR